MASSIRRLRTLAVLAAVALGLSAAAPGPSAPTLISGGAYQLGKQPDGNTIVFEGPLGLVVVDTGRHKQHQAKILQLAKARGKPITAIVNTHWHLDHTGGNQELRAVFPHARIYASNAVRGALNGFLARSLAEARRQLADPTLSAAQKAEIRLGLDAVEDRKDLLPDVAIARATMLPLHGRRLELHLAAHAATEGDVWIYDAASRTLVSGDLVVLPAPFFDTACPEGWRRALDAIANVPFRTLIPGHGAPMKREQFALYRTAFDRLVECSEGPQPKNACISAWQHDAAMFLATDEARKTAAGLLDYYFGAVLRSADKKREFCGS